MNTNNCPTNWATDEIFLCEPYIANPCSANVTAYIVAGSVLTGIRVLVLIQQYITWNTREQNKKHQNPNHNFNNTTNPNGKIIKRNLPVVVIMGLLTILLFILILVLTSYNMVSCKNGTSGLLLGIFFLPLNVSAALWSNRIIRLGRKLIPLSKMQLDMSTDKEASIAKEDNLLAILNRMSRFCMVLAQVSFIILCPIFPGYFWPIGLGITSWGCNDFLCSTAWAYQLHRLVVVTSQAQNREGDGGRVNRAIALLQFQKRLLIFAGYPHGLFWFLIVSGVVQFSYIVWLIIFGTEVLAMSLFALRFRGGKMTRTNTSSMKSSTSHAKKNDEIVPAMGGSTTTNTSNQMTGSFSSPNGFNGNNNGSQVEPRSDQQE
jgi:hypothetical protein